MPSWPSLMRRGGASSSSKQRVSPSNRGRASSPKGRSDHSTDAAATDVEEKGVAILGNGKPTDSTEVAVPNGPSTQKKDSIPFQVHSKGGRRLAMKITIPAEAKKPADVGRQKKDPQARVSTVPAPYPSVYSSQGIKISVVDWELRIFILHLVTPEACDWMRRVTDEYVAERQSQGFQVWRRLFTYTEMDLPCVEVVPMRRMVQAILWHINQVLQELCRVPAPLLHPRSWKEPHLLHYQVKPDDPERDHKGVEMHYDGSDWTWNMVLSDPSEYTGGGTYIRCLRRTLRLGQGQVLVHPGGLYHKGVDIESGSRRLMVCFLDGCSPGVTDPSDNEHQAEWESQVVQT